MIHTKVPKAWPALHHRETSHRSDKEDEPPVAQNLLTLFLDLKNLCEFVPGSDLQDDGGQSPNDAKVKACSAKNGESGVH